MLSGKTHIPHTQKGQVLSPNCQDWPICLGVPYAVATKILCCCWQCFNRNKPKASLTLIICTAQYHSYRDAGWMTWGWLEPLLDRIAQNRSNVVAPVIDLLADDTLRYRYSSATSTFVGGFDWNLEFNWHAMPERERKRRKSDVEPVR